MISFQSNLDFRIFFIYLGTWYIHGMICYPTSKTFYLLFQFLKIKKKCLFYFILFYIHFRIMVFVCLLSVQSLAYQFPFIPPFILYSNIFFKRHFRFFKRSFQIIYKIHLFSFFILIWKYSIYLSTLSSVERLYFL